MEAGELVKTNRQIRSQKTGVILPREGTFVRAVENMGRTLILVHFIMNGNGVDEYLFENEIEPQPHAA